MSTCRWMLPLVAFLLFAVPVVSVPAWSQDGADTQEETVEAQNVALRAGIRERTIALLAARLGVPPKRLEDSVDLVRDLGLDHLAVHYAVSEAFEVERVQRPDKELTKVADIVESIFNRVKLGVNKAATRAAVEKQTYVQTVYYATDREKIETTQPEAMFTGDRSPEGVVRYGRVNVNIPAEHKVGQIETPWLGFKWLRSPKSHMYILDVANFDKTEFLAEIAAGTKSGRDILVYVHGFNVSFEDAVVRAAQISFDFGFKGLPLVFTWPSKRKVTAYNYDWENVNWSTQHIERFLEDVVAQANGRRVHIVAHSMGTKGVLNALRLLAYRGRKDMFASVLLCAPDFDAGMFQQQIASEIRPLAKQWVVYQSKRDVALTASASLNTLRLGQPINVADGYEIVDASEVEVTPWSLPETHSYYATKKVVIDDMINALDGVEASKRKLKSSLVGSFKAWSFEAAQ